MQASPQVVVTGQGGERAGGVAVPLVQEGGEGGVHPLRTLRTPKLLCLKHLSAKAEQWASSVAAAA